MADFHQFLMICFMECINIGPVYNFKEMGGKGIGLEWVVAKAKTKKEVVEFRVAIYDVLTY